MNRALLERLSAFRWPVAVAGAALFIAAAGATVWQGWRLLSASAAPVFDRGAYPEEERELRFWLAALRRMEAEQQQHPDGTPMASLQREQAAVLQRLREVAERVPPGRLPAEIGAVLDRTAMPDPQSAAATAPADAAAPSAAAAPPQPIELRVGLGSRAEMPDFSSLAVSVPPLLPVTVVERRPAPHRKASAEHDEKRPPKDRDEKRPAQ